MNVPAKQHSAAVPLLLVSVRNASEAADASAGGADIVDVKEPSRGPLGAADWQQVQEVLHFVREQRPVSIAAGELLDSNLSARIVPDGTQFVKFGLARCARIGGWQSLLEQAQNHLLAGAQIVPVAYADWLAAESPTPREVLQFATDHACPILLIDTFQKERGGLFEFWNWDSIAELIDAAHSAGTAIALAGGLRGDRLAWAVAAGADVVGVRGAVCDSGRAGKLQRRLVAQVRHALDHHHRLNFLRSGKRASPTSCLTTRSNSGYS
ncbi:MAG: (5-formylfuran-3-yl)methyl phosphate synthase [Pirellulales bacterium]